MNVSRLPFDRSPPNAGWADALGLGLPDAMTSLWCLTVWLHPLAFGTESVKCVVLMLAMEFFLIHATGFFMCIPFMIRFRRRTRIVMLLGLCALYLLLVAYFARMFQAIWPYLTLIWMVAAKIVWILRNRRTTPDEQVWIVGSWAVSVVAYLGAVGIGAALTVPYFGITPNLAATLHLPGHGEWIDEPHRAVASAAMYFAALAAFKWAYLAMRRRKQGSRRSPLPDAVASRSMRQT